MEKRRLIWLPRAVEDVEEHCAFLAEMSEKKADELFNVFFNETDILITHPNIGAREPSLLDFSECYRYLVVWNNYKIIYELTVGTVFIHTVWDCRRNPLNLTLPQSDKEKE